MTSVALVQQFIDTLLVRRLLMTKFNLFYWEVTEVMIVRGDQTIAL